MGLRVTQAPMNTIHRSMLASTIVLGAGCFAPGTPPPFGREADSGSVGAEEMVSGDTGDTSTSTSLDGASTEAVDGSGTGLVEPGDTTPPEVVGFLPVDGTSHVWDETVTITFSEPMDQASVEAVFPEATAFVWDSLGTRVEITASFPFESVPVFYDLVVPTSVTDLAGNGLAEAVEVTIELAALETATLLHEPGLTGMSFADMDYTALFFQGGDNWANLLFHAGISFSLAELDSAVAIRRATYRSQVLRTSGDITGVGGLVVDHVSFDSLARIDDPELLETAFASLFTSDSTAAGDLVELDVTSRLASSWSTGAEHFQLRFHPISSDGDDFEDSLVLRRGADEDDHLVPDDLAEPDPDNQSRIEVEYFR